LSCSEEQNTQPSSGGVNNWKNRAEYRRKRTHLKQIVKKKEELDDTFMYSPKRLYGDGPQDKEDGTYPEGAERKEFNNNNNMPGHISGGTRGCALPTRLWRQAQLSCYTSPFLLSLYMVIL
jgi:hypothetical protein